MTTSSARHLRRGRGEYKVGDFAAAEQSFRRLLDAVPMTDGKEYGRAAHSLAMTLVKLGRSPEAIYMLRTAIHADPSLQRARVLLAELESADQHGVANELPVPRTAGGLVGVADESRRGGAGPHLRSAAQQLPEVPPRDTARPTDGRAPR